MKRKIFLALFFSMLAGVVVAAAATWLLLERVSSLRAQEALELFATRLSQTPPTTRADLAALDASPWRVTLIAPDGTVLLDNRADPHALANHRDRPEIEEALKSGVGSSARFSATLEERTLYRAVRLTDGRLLRVASTLDTPWREKKMLMLGALLLLVFGAALSWLLAGRLASRIVAPINQLELDDPSPEALYEELAPLVSRLREQRQRIDAGVQRIKEQNRTLRTIANGLSEGLVVLDTNGHILSMNASAARTLGLNAETSVGEALALPFSGWDFAAMHSIDEKEHQQEVKLGSRTYRFYLTRVSRRNRLMGYVLFILDMTLEKEAEAQRREFTANVSHELKTPLQSIVGASELLEHGLVKAEDVPQFGGRIRREGARLVAIVNDLIFLSRLDEGATPLPEHTEAQSVTLRSIVGEVFERISPEAQAKHITLEMSGALDIACTEVRCLTELIRNLCENAVKYHTGEGRVRVTASRSRTHLRLDVEDDGPGIAAEERAHIFERFYRGEHARARRIEGTGLGLSIVKRVARYLGGSVSLFDGTLGGAAFRVEIPLNALGKGE